MTDTSFATAGSQRWLQLAVTRAPEFLSEALAEAGALKSQEEIRWTAPLQSNGFVEPRDAEALHKAGISDLPRRSLVDFWPKGGPVWDAVAQVGKQASLFVEAKAHIVEAASPPSKATPTSLSKIKSALAEARNFYAPNSTADWHRIFYQYANRLAHHYLLTELNGLDSRLVFLYFLNAHDVRGPASVAEWEAATTLIHAALGLPADISRFGVYHAYFDVRKIAYLI